VPRAAARLGGVECFLKLYDALKLYTARSAAPSTSIDCCIYARILSDPSLPCA